MGGFNGSGDLETEALENQAEVQHMDRFTRMEHQLYIERNPTIPPNPRTLEFMLELWKALSNFDDSLHGMQRLSSGVTTRFYDNFYRILAGLLSPEPETFQQGCNAVAALPNQVLDLEKRLCNHKFYRSLKLANKKFRMMVWRVRRERLLTQFPEQHSGLKRIRNPDLDLDTINEFVYHGLRLTQSFASTETWFGILYHVGANVTFLKQLMEDRKAKLEAGDWETSDEGEQTIDNSEPDVVKSEL